MKPRTLSVDFSAPRSHRSPLTHFEFPSLATDTISRPNREKEVRLLHLNGLAFNRLRYGREVKQLDGSTIKVRTRLPLNSSPRLAPRRSFVVN